MDDAQLAGTYIHILALAHTAARHALAHGPVGDADRPLAIAQYAERSIDALRAGAERPLALVRLASTSVEALTTTVNEKLEAAVHQWVNAAEPEVVRLVPCADTMRMLANQGAHLYAVTHQVLAATRQSLPDAESLPAVSECLVSGGRALQEADKAWDKLTTASRPGHEFVTASRELFTALQAVEQLMRVPDPSWDVARGTRDLNRAIDALADILEISRDLPDRLLRSGLVYAPARSLPRSLTRMRAQRHGTYLPVTPEDAPELQERWTAAATEARTVQHYMGAVALPATDVPLMSMDL